MDMNKPSGESCYTSKLSLLDTQKAIKIIKDFFEKALVAKLNLTRVSAPLFVEPRSGLNDDLDGYARPVTFDVKSGTCLSIVHSLAKWKRMALKKYQFEINFGLYTDMNAIRRDEDLSPLHSYYVDQWDWEKTIMEEDRNMEYLKSIVRDIYECLKATEEEIVKRYPCLTKKLPEQIVFVSSQEMEDEYPNLSPKERETMFSRKHGAMFVTQIGKVLKSGQKHDVRAPDYDDWELNGDIIFHYPMMDIAFEITSMGIRVSKESLLQQLTELDKVDQLNLPFHDALINGEMPFSVGGGIGQSRLCMFLLDKLHIGEVQASYWDSQTLAECKKKNIALL